MKTQAKKHTPGPWIIYGKGCAVYNAELKKVIAHTAFKGTATPIIEVTEEIAANARLIAAAPELLLGCKEALAVLLENTKVRNLKTESFLREIIAKAEGRP